MSVRSLFALAALALPTLTGCGEAPSATFSTSDESKKLDRAARTAVESEISESFGTPNRLVVWQKLPVDFGDFEGVVEQPAESATGDFAIRLTRKPDSAVPIEPGRLQGAAILWTSGPNTDLYYEDAKGKHYPEFQVVHYDPAKSLLRMRVSPAVFANEVKPPKSGEKFAVLGPALQYGHHLYMLHCMHCHGVTGDGNGPTASYLSPRPRDYRMGRFKFTSTKSTDRARRDDLARTVHQGIPGTYMPSFLLLKEDELAAVVEYVRWLSMRGEDEHKLVAEFAAEYSTEAINQRMGGTNGESREDIEKALKKFIKEDFPEKTRDAVDQLATAWKTAETPESLVVPKKARTPDSPASRKHGRELFFSEKGKCVTCHGPGGRGDGPQTEDYQQIEGTNKKRTTPGLFDDWGNAITPRDLTSGIYRGGRRPIDLYRRISSGIKGTPMPPFGTVLTDEEIWDIINYVMSLPYQKESPYPEPQPKIASSGEAHRQADAIPVAGREGN